MSDEKSFFEGLKKAEPGYEDSRTFGDFNVDDKNIKLDDRTGQKFTKGDFKLDPQMREGMASYGKDMQGLDAKYGLDLANSKEFKGADFNKDGKIDANEIGAVVMAASMRTTVGEPDFGIPGANVSGTSASFNNVVTFDNMKKLLDPESKATVMEIAKQLLGDNGVKVGEDTNSPQSNQRVMAAIEKKPDETMRC